jgi:hypothetical protein
MYRQFIRGQIINRSGSGNQVQYHVALTDSEGNKEFLWMSSADYIDWIEDPIALTGKSVMFDPSTYHAFS